MLNFKQKKIFVLDTSVILFNHQAILHFDDNDVAIPITVLEELDNFKKGHDTKNYEAREFIRIIDDLSAENSLQDWVSLGDKKGKIKVIMDENGHDTDAKKIFGADKADHRILNAAISVAAQYPKKKVTVVTKDINLRLKARALNLEAEDYETIRIQDIDHLYQGKTELHLEADKANLINDLYEEGHIDPADLLDEAPTSNHYYILKSDTSSALCVYNPFTNRLEPVYKEQAYGITPRNAEQTFALHAIMNQDVLLTTITGAAGTGKTLLALAAALEQRSQYKQIFLARPIVPLSNKDIGYLPGDIKSKIDPFMQPLYDNLGFIKNQYNETDKPYKRINEMIENDKLHIVPLAYIRGRSLSNVIFIVDEAQNLTPHEVKTIITRAGDNTKIVFTGDIFQIDTPYLDAQSNGLSYLVDRVHNKEIYAHVNLVKGERSVLANLASEML